MSRGDVLKVDLNPPETQTLSPVKAARRDKILDAAERLFVQQGFRGTTMEAIAEAVAMSKVTVYGYFKDKDAVFAAVAERLSHRLLAAVSAALDAQACVQESVAAALIAKHSIIFDLVRTSPFSSELFAAKDRIVEEIFARLDRNIEALLAARLAADGIEGPGQTARIAFRAAQGIANHSANIDEAGRDIRVLVYALI